MAFLVWHAGASPGMGTDGTPGNPSVPHHPGRHMHHVTVSLCCTLAYWRFCTNGRFLMAPARDSTTYGPGGLVALTPSPFSTQLDSRLRHMACTIPSRALYLERVL